MNKVNYGETIGEERTRVEEISTDFHIELRNQNSFLISKLLIMYKSNSLIMAGMYTGLNCYGAADSGHKAIKDADSFPSRPI